MYRAMKNKNVGDRWASLVQVHSHITSSYEDGFRRGVKDELAGVGIFVAGPQPFVRGYMEGRLSIRGKKELSK